MRRLAMRTCAALSIGAAIGCADPAQAPGPALLSVVAPPPAHADPGSVLPPITIRLADANGTPAAGRRVLVEGDGTIVPSDSVTDASGRLTITWTLPRAAEVGFVNGSFGLEGDHSLIVRTRDGEVDERWTTRTAWFRADQIDAAFSYGCGIVQAALWCFGRTPPNLAEGPRAVRPVRVILPAGVVPAEVRVNGDAACLRNASDGRPWCVIGWRGPAGFRPVPDAPSFVQIVDAGRRFCGRTAEGIVACWIVRSRSDEEPGFGVVTVVDTMRFVALAGQTPGAPYFPIYTHACGLDTRGDVWCWGDNLFGRLGVPAPDSSMVPVQVPVPGPMTSIRVGTEGACASSATGQTWCWGDYFGPNDYAPRQLEREGPPGSVLTPGHWELFEFWPGHLRAVFYSSRYEPFPGLTKHTQIAEMVSEGQACAHGASREVFCSWILLRGGGDTSPFTAALVPVPAP